MNKLLTWETQEYYTKAKEGSLRSSHPGMKILQKYVENNNITNVLDIGCGEGTRLASLIKKKDRNKKGYGVDISNIAISLAKKNYSYLNFQKSDIEKIPFEENSFDLIYSAYVLEHLSKPEILLKEAKRLLKTNGVMVLIAPNYGSPNRSSPCFKGSRIKKIVKGYVDDFLRVFSNKLELNWNKVKPISSKKKYEIDWDCQIEPYVGSLVNYLKKNGFNILEYSTCWEEERKHSSILQKIIYIYAKLGLYPFNYWGPHFVVAARKLY